MKTTLIAILALLFSIANGQEMQAPKSIPDSTGAKVNATKPVSLYVCPMHPDVTSEKPGKCPKCKMDLVKTGPVKVKDKKAVYACPMDAEVTSEQPGRCPICGMALVLKKNR